MQLFFNIFVIVFYQSPVSCKRIKRSNKVYEKLKKKNKYINLPKALGVMIKSYVTSLKANESSGLDFKNFRQFSFSVVDITLTILVSRENNNYLNYFELFAFF